MAEKDLQLNTAKTYEINIDDATPMMQQFLKIKKQSQDVLLFYRMGDFYETFFEDAITASKALEITLTGREGGKLGRIPMAGVPQKAADNYISRLIEKGFKVAICEQMEDPALAKGLVDRQVVKTISAGTITETDLLDATKNNYLASVFKSKRENLYGFAYIDISTGEFKATQLELNHIIAELSRISPAEVLAPAKKKDLQLNQIVAEKQVDLPNEIAGNYNFSKREGSSFAEERAVDKIKSFFNVNSLESFGYPDFKEGLIAAGAIIEYLEETQLQNIPNLDVIVPYSMNSYVSIDSNTRRNLELVQTVRDKCYKGSLLWAINRTKTSMGTRLLRKWIQQPLQSIDSILKRQNGVEELFNNSMLRVELASLLDRVYDIERLATKISNNSINPRDFVALKDSLNVLPRFSELLQESASYYLKKLSNIDNKLVEFSSIIERTIQYNPPVGLKEGKIINEGVNENLDNYRNLLNGGKEWLVDFEQKEKEKSGIKSLKVGYSKNFGYFLEVSRANSSMVPDNYIRKQTLTNAERYITPELKTHETEVLSAETKVVDLEYQIFCDLRDYANEFVEAIRSVAKDLSVIDVLLSFADVAVEYNYIKPEVNDSKELVIKEGRHPVIEQLLPLGQYVANELDLTGGDYDFSNNKCQFMILTGPNMAGKSTYMRQNALIVLLAQIGCYVPASKAQIGIIDKIFTRVGAVDDLSTGQSTFMVEMNETAFILNSATERSLVLLDEIGRGTSTYDGVAIAWSVIEYMVERIKARTIFATHYHEINVICNKMSQVQNYKVTVSENDGDIQFLRQVVPGGTSRSYGIQVAKMAGLPNNIILRAQSLMNKMQKDNAAKINVRKQSNTEIEISAPQLSLFSE